MVLHTIITHFLTMMMIFLVVIMSSATAGFAALTPITSASIKDAALEWMTDKGTAKLKYGEISLWKTGDVTNMNELFYDSSRTVSNDNFREDLSKWDVSNVTNMVYVLIRARLSDSSAHLRT